MTNSKSQIADSE